MKRWSVVLLLLVLSLPALAYEPGGLDDVNKTVQASMVVTGIIAVNPDGSVYGYSLDQRSKLPAEIVDLIGQTLPQWKFMPVKVNGKPVRARARMSLRVVAQQSQPKHWVATVEGAQFADDAEVTAGTCPPGACVAYAMASAPSYPSRLVQSGVAGTVYLKVDINRQGRVIHAAVAQVDLHKLSISSQLKRWRHEFASATLKAARKWTFHVPTVGDQAKNDHWVVEVPVNFDLMSGGQEIVGSAGYGQWNDYVPGPVHSIPWAESKPNVYNNIDAIPDTGLPFTQDPRFVLLTPPGGGNTTSQQADHASHG